MDVALRGTATGVADDSATPAGGRAAFVADFADLADLTSQTPHAEAKLADALLAMEMAPGSAFRSLEAPVELAERLAIELGHPELEMRARLVRADILRRAGDTTEAGRVAHQVNAWAAEHNDAYLLARSHHQLALFYRHVGDLADALGHAVQSVAHLGEEVPAHFRARHLSILGMVLDEHGSWEEALRRNQEALDIASAADDVEMLLRILNNMAYTAYEHEDHEQARDLVERMRAIETRYGLPLEASDLDTIARIEIMHGRYADAEAMLRPILDGSAGYLVTEGMELADCLLTVAEAQRLRGDIEAAQATLDRAAGVCDERGLASIRARVREEQAQLHAANDRYREAYEEYLLFHADTQALQSIQREARARALQAVYETQEARRESLRFRELAERDALTGLHNRRYVDEHLPSLLERAVTGGVPLSAALVDLDHFKRVNDTLSHAVGDLVLKQVAGLLADAARDGGLAVRLGGEEFLLVFPDTGADEAVRRCEQVRRTIQRYPWRPITGEVPVTASIGVTTVCAETTASALLAQADQNLYAAKRAGRNRIIADPA